MPWLNFWSHASSQESNNGADRQDSPSAIGDDLKSAAHDISSTIPNEASRSPSKPSSSSEGNSTAYSLTNPSTLISTAVLTTAVLTLYSLQRRFLRRIPNAAAIPQTYILPSTRRFTRSLFGHVTSIGDADNFRLFHTPLGRLAFWGLLRKVPNDAKALKDKTVHIRLAGVDAPELSHFGRPAQPYSKEALDWLTSYLRGRRVRCYVHKADQYGRVVATVYVRKGLLRRDVGLQMLRAGFATVYEAKSGAEFGGEGVEENYREAEKWSRKRRKGMWKEKERLESPREYKNRYREGGAER